MVKLDQKRVFYKNVLPFDSKGWYIMYWMQASQRSLNNPALDFAINLANENQKPLLVQFVMTTDYPDANQRHYQFMLEGLVDVENDLKKRGIAFQISLGDIVKEVLKVSQKACCIVMDSGYMPIQRNWRKSITDQTKRLVIEIEGDISVPHNIVSQKAEIAARTIRSKINKLLKDYKIPIQSFSKYNVAEKLKTSQLTAKQLLKTIQDFSIDHSIQSVSKYYQGGQTKALQALENFIKHNLKNYSQNTRALGKNSTSHLSPYLHFGHISTPFIIQKIKESSALNNEKDAFLEQLIIRRELSINFVTHQPNYNKFSSLPGWSIETLKIHKSDQRDYKYEMKELINAKTHDPYWNSAMIEMIKTGFMQGYIRMYWGKKILKWSKNPEEAYHTLITLNNKYFLDGRDPNSYANCSWIFGLFDHPWKERPIYGKVRCMVKSGLEKKCTIKEYVQFVENL